MASAATATAAATAFASQNGLVIHITPTDIIDYMFCQGQDPDWELKAAEALDDVMLFDVPSRQWIIQPNTLLRQCSQLASRIRLSERDLELVVGYVAVATRRPQSRRRWSLQQAHAMLDLTFGVSCCLR